MAWGMAKRHEAAIHQLKNRILSLVTEQLAFWWPSERCPSRSGYHV